LSQKKEEVSIAENQPAVMDVEAPEIIKATILLPGGRRIALDSLTSGTLLAEGNIRVTKNENGIIYSNENASGEVIYNTLVNPRGSKVTTLTLVDGTKVWLNSESSIKYYTSVGKERNVEITGEGYFEVAKDAARRFTVTANDVLTEVTGTYFNVNSYKEENKITVTLLEGSVVIKKGTATEPLKPGQQAQVTKTIKVLNDIDTDAVMAWKNGLFQFKNADLPTVVTQLARWYDLDVYYEGNIPVRLFEGKIQRDLNLSYVLEGLARNQVRYKIEGKKLTILE
jgi:hypothetical protein